MSELTLKLIEVFLPAVLALVGAALTLGTVYLKRKATVIANEEVRSAMRDALERAKSAVFSAVRATAQTYTDDLKASNEDGKITPAEAAEARRRSQEHFLRVLGQEGVVQLEAVVGDVQRWFESYLESVVADLKLR